MIFECNTNRFETKGKEIVSFSDCPNKCTDGWIYDPYTKVNKQCEYCAKKRANIVKDRAVDTKTNKAIEEILHLPISYKGVDFNIQEIVPKSERALITDESFKEVTTELKNLMVDIKHGELPSYSILFNLGKKVYEGSYIYSLISNAYIQGITTTPLLTAFDIVRLRKCFNMDRTDDEFKDLTYSDLLSKQLVVIDIEAGAPDTDVLAVKGLIQLRALRGYPTVIFTNAWTPTVKSLCDDQYSLNIAKLSSIKYNTKTEEIKNSSTLTSEQFRNLINRS